MADPAPLDAHALPPLTPQSRRIQAAIEGFGVARDLGVAARPLPAFESIDTERAPIVILKEEHLISRVAAEARALERPPAVEEWMGTCTAQFFLRNTHRATRPEANPDALQFARAPRHQIEPAGAAVAVAIRDRRRLEADTATARLSTYVAQRARLMVEPLPDHFGRPDPAEVQEP